MRAVGVAVALVLLASLVSIPSASASNVSAGLDRFETVPGQTFQDFSVTPIPPGFFDPGSLPFSGTVHFKGVPLPGQGTTDTVVQRKQNAILPPPFPVSDTIEIELVQLQLVSVSPIQVQYPSGPPEAWDLWVFPSPTVPSQGQMTITHEHNNGGTFDSVLNVCPVFVFLRVSDDAARVIDTCPAGIPPITLIGQDVPWCHTAGPHIFQDPGSDFFPGVKCPPKGQGAGSGKQLTPEQAQLAAHGVLPAQRHEKKVPPPLQEDLQTVLDILAGHGGH